MKPSEVNVLHTNDARNENSATRAFLCFPVLVRNESNFCLAASNIQSIDISYNKLGSTGAELFLKCLKPTSVTDLEMTATVQSYSVNHLTKHLVSYCQQVREKLLFAVVFIVVILSLLLLLYVHHHRSAKVPPACLMFVTK